MTQPRLIAAPMLCALLLAGCHRVAPAPEQPQSSALRGELRGLWVDAFGPGFKTPEEVTRLVDDARAMNVNTLYVQAGRRGDCYCNLAAMPRTDDPAVPAGFDPLADVIAKAHAKDIQVYAWIITTALWNSATPPASPDHAFNRHGPAQTGRDNWLMVKSDGSVKGGNDWLLDPGHPDAAEYIKNMYVSVAQNYDVDGLQFDRVRYPDYNPVGGPSQWGYNATALERYRAETGASGVPDPADPQWSAWRRDQVTQLVRETTLAVKAVKPAVVMAAATITYGEGPLTEADFATKRPYTEVAQDWLSWVKLGYLDQNVMMNYKRDFNPSQSLWYGQWNAFAASLEASSPLTEQVSGAALYINDVASSLNQIRKAQAAGLGWAGYSYRNPSADVAASPQVKPQDAVIAELRARLTEPDGPFPTFVKRSGTPAQTLRALSGEVRAPIPGGQRVTLRSASGEELAVIRTDGQGRYGFLNVPGGQLSVQVGDQILGGLQAQTGRVVSLPTITLP